MKKLMKKINFALIAAMASVAPALAAPAAGQNPLCALAQEFGYIFSIVRTLAFLGAGVTIAGWAWGYISGGKIDAIKEVKEKGIALLIGFVLLFGIGTVLQVFINMSGQGGSLGCDINAFFGSGAAGM